nr:unnamed protein product [Callosobruchus analis]
MGDYGKPGMAGSPSKDSMGGKTAVSGFCARSAPTSLRRPPSSRFPPAAAAAGRFRKGLAARCTWRCAAVAFIALSVGLVAALTYISASSLLNWSYQNTKPCVLVGDNTQVVPASKSAPSETNLSTSTRPKTQSASTGENEVPSNVAQEFAVTEVDYPLDATEPPEEQDNSGSTSELDVQENIPSHLKDIPLGPGVGSENQYDIEDAPGHFDVATTYANGDDGSGDESQLREQSVTTLDQKINSEGISEITLDLVRDSINAALPTTEFMGDSKEQNQPESPHVTSSDSGINLGIPSATTVSSLDTSESTTNKEKDNLNMEAVTDSTGISEEAHDISDSSLFTLEDEVYEDMKKDYEGFPKSSEFQHDAPIFSVKVGNTDSEEEALLEKVQSMSKKVPEKSNPLDVPGAEDSDILRKSYSGYDGEAASRKVIDKNLMRNKPQSEEGKPFVKAQDSSKELADANLSIMPLNQSPDLKASSFNNPLFVHNPTNQDAPANRLKVLEVPPAPSMHPSNRFLVNVTIAADNSQPVYVLSVSVPMDGKGEAQVMSKEAPEPLMQNSEKKAPVGIFEEDKDASGGACECSCPCLDSSNEFSDGNSSLEFDYGAMDAKETQTSILTTTELAETMLTTPTTCPEVTAPPPMILVLEGARTFPAQSFPPDGTTFSQISLGQRLSREIRPYGYWNMQFYQSEAAYVQFDYIIPRGASIGVYARRNALPTHTQYHILEVLSGFKARTSRASHSTVKKEVTHYMEQGHWFLSLYNDDGEPQEVTFIATIAEDMTHNCPNGCSGNGDCLMGHCQCNPGFGGDDCSDSKLYLNESVIHIINPCLNVKKK